MFIVGFMKVGDVCFDWEVCEEFILLRFGVLEFGFGIKFYKKFVEEN